ncbi:hypothetical protein IVB30_35925 [Bradyrhizobium sp. 200]|uniref:hypothetical protein n=1 Tax=Bradyrhizobium sp. 200 TaxID=2782665 RepID=UPI001FFF7AC4|nr:hypothetical protein [Bradyrhizobium sp. 200]UPJ48394.1 hypothetical protein IVB30_35925 [Bradyrhizobium sp. 200]
MLGEHHLAAAEARFTIGRHDLANGLVSEFYREWDSATRGWQQHIRQIALALVEIELTARADERMNRADLDFGP